MGHVIDIAMTSWPNHPARLGYLREILNAMETYLTTSTHDVRVYLSAESERDPKHEWCGDELEALCQTHGIAMQWRDAPANLGANMNAAMAMGSGELVYLQQDDWRLNAPLDLSPGADLLYRHRDLDLVRYCWPDNDRMRPTFRDDIEGWRLIDLRGKWPYGDDPHLRRRDFMDKWGWYYDRGKHGTASGALMHKLVRRGAKIVVADRCYYQHCGYASAVIDDVRAGRNRRKETMQ